MEHHLAQHAGDELGHPDPSGAGRTESTDPGAELVRYQHVDPRCLVKAIALHGLGLYIYAGEDLPQAVTEAANDGVAPTKPPEVAAPVPARTYAAQTISPAQQTNIQRLALGVGTDVERVVAHFGVSSLKDIRVADYLRVVRSLEKRRAA